MKTWQTKNFNLLKPSREVKVKVTKSKKESFGNIRKIMNLEKI